MKRDLCTLSIAFLLMACAGESRAAGVVRPDDPRIAALAGKEAVAVREVMKSLVEAGVGSVAALVPVIDKDQGDLSKNTREVLFRVAARAWAAGHQKEVSLALVEQMQPGYSAETRRWICRMLAVVGDDECVDPLYRWLADEQIGEEVRRTLIAIPTRNTIEALVGGLQLVVNDPLLAILDALGAKGERTAVPVLKMGAENADDPIRSRARDALARLADPVALATIKRAVEAKEPGAMRALLTVAEALADDGADQDARDAFRAAGLRNEATAIDFCRVLHGLGQVGTVEDAKFILDRLADTSRWGKFQARVQAASYDALASMPGTGVNDAITEAVGRLPNEAKKALQEVLARRQTSSSAASAPAATAVPASKPAS